MPFKSKKQMRYLFAKEPEVAKKWVKEAKEKHEPYIEKKEHKKTFKK